MKAILSKLRDNLRQFKFYTYKNYFIKESIFAQSNFKLKNNEKAFIHFIFLL